MLVQEPVALTRDIPHFFVEAFLQSGGTPFCRDDFVLEFIWSPWHFERDNLDIAALSEVVPSHVHATVNALSECLIQLSLIIQFLSLVADPLLSTPLSVHDHDLVGHFLWVLLFVIAACSARHPIVYPLGLTSLIDLLHALLLYLLHLLPLQHGLVHLESATVLEVLAFTLEHGPHDLLWTIKIYFNQ